RQASCGGATRTISTGHGARGPDRTLDGARACGQGVVGVTIPRVVAHRGSSASHPDNSWAAFEAAVTENADAIECDVVATDDGVLVIRHDLSIVKRFVCNLTANELEAAEPGLVRLGELLAWA